VAANFQIRKEPASGDLLDRASRSRRHRRRALRPWLASPAAAIAVARNVTHCARLSANPTVGWFFVDQDQSGAAASGLMIPPL
jgi:hypothetical protein